jgi:hypothetical protein
MGNGSEPQGEVEASIILNVMGLRELAVYGFRSWMLQDYDRPYEIVLNLYNDARPMFDKLLPPLNPNCRVQINVFDAPEFFNISATNNLGLHLARGKFVFWANADIIYPAQFLKHAMAELIRRDIYFAVASRVNLSRPLTHEITAKPPEDYASTCAFDHLPPLERTGKLTIWRAISPWIMRRDTANAIGGFDARVLVAEDRDLMIRAMHYLRRMGLQHALFSLSDLSGFHLDHDSTGLARAMDESVRLMKERETLMDADPNSAADVINTPLHDRKALLDTIRLTRRPPAVKMQGGMKKVARRAQKVWQTMLHG